MAALNIHILGSPEVKNKHTLITIQRKPPRGLLYYLALQNCAVSRDILQDLLWNKIPRKTARHNLSVTINRLKKNLPAPDLLITNSQNIQLDFDHVHVDARDFLRFEDEIRKAFRLYSSNKPLPAWLVQQVQEALQLWYGGVLLDGASIPATTRFSEWLSITRENFAGKRLTLLNRLTQHYQISGEYDQAITLSKNYLARHPWDAVINARLIQLWRLSGASHKIQEHIDHLASIDKSMTDDLLNQIGQNQEGNPRTVPSHQKLVGITSAETEDAKYFIGRTKILGEMQAALQTGGGILLTGDFGMGKSTLLNEFIERLPDNRRLLFISCIAKQEGLPYHALRTLLAHIDPEEWHNIRPASQKALSFLLPELKEQHPGITELSIQPFSQLKSLLIFALEELFQSISRQHPLLLCFDNVHWADKASLEILSAVLQKPPFHHQALIIFTAQDQNISQLQRTLHPSPKARPLRIIQLPPFTPQETEQMIDAMIGKSTSLAFKHFFHEKSAGNPFFLTELLKAFQEQYPQPDLDLPPSDLKYPQSILEVTQFGLNELPYSQFQTLQLLAIGDYPCTAEFIDQITQFTPQKIRVILENLEQRGWLKTTRQSQKTIYTLSSPIIRQEILTTLSPSQIRDYHAQIAHTLENLAAYQTPEESAQLARHFQAAEKLQKAYQYWIKAGQAHHQNGELNAAHKAFQHAYHILEQIQSQLCDEDIVQLFSAWGDVLAERDDTVGLQHIFSKLMQIGNRRNCHYIIGVAFTGLGKADLVSNQLEQGIHHTENAINYLQEDPTHLYQYTWAVVVLGTLHYLVGQVSQSISSFDIARELATQIDDSTSTLAIHGHINYQLGLLSTLQGKPLLGRKFGLQSLEQHTLLQYAFGVLMSKNLLALSEYYLGNFSEAQKHCQIAIKLGESKGFWRFLGYAYYIQSQVSWAMGEVGEATKYAYQALTVGKTYHHPEISALGYQIVGDVYRSLLQPEHAMSFYQKAHQESKNSFVQPDITFRIGLTSLLNNNLSNGEQHIQKAIQDAQNQGVAITLISSKLAFSKILVQKKQWETAQSVAQDVFQIAQENKMCAERLQAELLLAHIEWFTKNKPSAIEKVRVIAEEAASIPHFWVELSAQKLLLQMLSKQHELRMPVYRRILALLESVRMLEHNPLADPVTDLLEHAVENFPSYMLTRI